MSRLFLIILGLIAVLAAIIVVVPSLIPSETYKAQIISAVKQNTGRDLTIGGDVGLSVFPRLAVSAADVRLSNAPWAREPDMITMEEMRVALKILPLLSGTIELDSFHLIAPVIHLEVDRQGVPNWQFSPSPAAGTDAQGDTPKAPDAAEGDASDAGAGASIQMVRLGDVGIENGRASYRNAQSGADFALEDINLDLSMPDLDHPFEANGSVTWNGEPLDLALAVARPAALTSRKESPVTAQVQSSKLTFNYDGILRLLGGLSYGGKVELDVPSVRNLAAWAGSPLPKGQGFGPLAITGKVKGTNEAATFSDADISFDGMKATGTLSVVTSRSRPYLKGNLALDRLDTNVYLGETAVAPDGQTGGSGAPAGPAAGGQTDDSRNGWSTAPIDLSGLKAIDMDFALQVGELLVQKLTIGETALNLKLSGGVLNADLTKLALYEGAGKGQLQLSGAGRTPALNASFSLSGLDAQPFLTDAMDIKRIAGTATADISLATSGGSQRAMIDALSGNGSVKFANGAIKGINLAQLMRTVFAAATTGWEAGGTRDTDFSELGGTFTINRGIVSNQDMKMLSPLLRIAGRGTVDLPHRTLAYRVEPKLAATLEGQGATGEAKGIEVPVIISGPWAKPQFRPDLAAVLQNPEGIKETVKSLKETIKKDGAKSFLKGLLGQPQAPEAQPAPEAAPEPAPETAPPAPAPQ